MYVTQPYDDALRHILDHGTLQKNRTGVDCLSVFSHTCRYRIDECFPLLTRRRLYPKAVFGELLWMLSGSTHNDDLVRLGCKFWTPWVEPNHPDNRAFYGRTGYPPGSLGPVYGWQMRHFGGDYERWLAGGDAGGVDQISWLVNEIKTNPTSRRLIVSLWNPADLGKMRLPPCHYVFHVRIHDGRMSLLLNQRSADLPVGAPANIFFYSALCYMLAQQTGYTPYEFIHHTEDAHIYVDQVEGVREYLSREPLPSPVLKLRKAGSIFDYRPEDFEILDYNPKDPIKMPVAV